MENKLSQINTFTTTTLSPSTHAETRQTTTAKQGFFASKLSPLTPNFNTIILTESPQNDAMQLQKRTAPASSSVLGFTGCASSGSNKRQRLENTYKTDSEGTATSPSPATSRIVSFSKPPSPIPAVARLSTDDVEHFSHLLNSKESLEKEPDFDFWDDEPSPQTRKSASPELISLANAPSSKSFPSPVWITPKSPFFRISPPVTFPSPFARIDVPSPRPYPPLTHPMPESSNVAYFEPRRHDVLRETTPVIPPSRSTPPLDDEFQSPGACGAAKNVIDFEQELVEVKPLPNEEELIVSERRKLSIEEWMGLSKSDLPTSGMADPGGDNQGLGEMDLLLAMVLSQEVENLPAPSPMPTPPPPELPQPKGDQPPTPPISLRTRSRAPKPQSGSSCQHQSKEERDSPTPFTSNMGKVKNRSFRARPPSPPLTNQRWMRGSPDPSINESLKIHNGRGRIWTQEEEELLLREYEKLNKKGIVSQAAFKIIAEMLEWRTVSAIANKFGKLGGECLLFFLHSL
ncbi:hypothetical protein T439DRAFT_335274 [Meredithblackwellia eburnea MCA 4105]